MFQSFGCGRLDKNLGVAEYLKTGFNNKLSSVYRTK